MNDAEQNCDADDQWNLVKKDDVVELIHTVMSTKKTHILKREDLIALYILQKSLHSNKDHKQHSR